jgi:ATP-binding cassette subfamily C exporter for protease/lipase
MTHRTSVLGVADKMLILRDGQQVAFGPRDEVMAALQQQQQTPQAPQAPAPRQAPVGPAPALASS